MDQASGNETTLVLVLSGPVYNATAGTLAFSVAPAAAGSKPKLSGGSAESALANGQAVSLLQPAAGLRLSVRPHEAARHVRKLWRLHTYGSSLPACDHGLHNSTLFHDVCLGVQNASMFTFDSSPPASKSGLCLAGYH